MEMQRLRDSELDRTRIARLIGERRELLDEIASLRTWNAAGWALASTLGIGLALALWW